MSFSRPNYGSLKLPIDTGGATALDRAKNLFNNLMNDADLQALGLTSLQACAIIGGLWHESAGLISNMNEGMIRGAPRGHGGFGLEQLTGPRQTEFVAWSKKNHLNPQSWEANVGFLKFELKTKFANQIQSNNTVTDLYNMVVSVTNYLEKPNARLAQIEKRFAFANQLATAVLGNKATDVLQTIKADVTSVITGTETIFGDVYKALTGAPTKPATSQTSSPISANPPSAIGFGDEPPAPLSTPKIPAIITPAAQAPKVTPPPVKPSPSASIPSL